MTALQLWVSLTRDTLREDKLGQAGQSRLTRLTPLMQHSLSPHTPHAALIVTPHPSCNTHCHPTPLMQHSLSSHTPHATLIVTPHPCLCDMGVG